MQLNQEQRQSGVVEKAQEIPSQLDILDKTTVSVSQQLEVLVNRLGPALKPCAPSQAGVGKESCIESPLAAAMRSITMRVSSQGSLLEDILNRLAL